MITIIGNNKKFGIGFEKNIDVEEMDVVAILPAISSEFSLLGSGIVNEVLQLRLYYKEIFIELKKNIDRMMRHKKGDNCFYF